MCIESSVASVGKSIWTPAQVTIARLFTFFIAKMAATKPGPQIMKTKRVEISDERD